MIGSAHGCVWCPVVVKPWAPRSTPLTQRSSHCQRSSSIHPLSDEDVRSKQDQSSAFQRIPIQSVTDDSKLKIRRRSNGEKDPKAGTDIGQQDFVSPIYHGPDTSRQQGEAKITVLKPIEEINATINDATIRTKHYKSVLHHHGPHHSSFAVHSSFDADSTREDLREVIQIPLSHYVTVKGDDQEPAELPCMELKPMDRQHEHDILMQTDFKQKSKLDFHQHTAHSESSDQEPVSDEISHSEFQHVAQISYQPNSVSSSNSVSSWSDCEEALPDVDALTTAAAAGDIATVKTLLMKGVDVNTPNSFGRTAVQVMAHDNADLAEVLLEAGGDPNALDVGKRTATSTLRTVAHDVAASGYTDVLRCLLRHGADISLQDRWGNTPLHLAAKAGHLSTVRYLWRGASLYIPNHLGKTALHIMEESKNLQIQQWVKKRKSTVPRLKTLCTLAVRKELGAHGLRCWRKHAPDEVIQRHIFLQSSRAATLLPSASASLSTEYSTKSQKSTSQDDAPGPSFIFRSEHPLEMLSLRDLVPRRLSSSENTSLEVQNCNSIHSGDDMSLGVAVTGSLLSETSSVFENTFSSVDPSHDESYFASDQFTEELGGIKKVASAK